MRLILSALAGLVLLTALPGCSSLVRSAHVETDSYSEIDPAYEGKTFSRVLVVAKVGDLKLRHKIESWCRSELLQLGVDSPPSTQVLPATRQLTVAERKRLLKQHQIQAILEVVPAAQGVHERYVPPTYKTTSETVEKRDRRGNKRFETVTKTEKTGGDYTLRSPWMKFEAKLIDAATGENAWISSATATGNDLADQDDVIRRQAKDFVQKLNVDNILSPAPIKNPNPTEKQLEDELGIELGS